MDRLKTYYLRPQILKSFSSCARSSLSEIKSFQSPFQPPHPKRPKLFKYPLKLSGKTMYNQWCPNNKTTLVYSRTTPSVLRSFQFRTIKNSEAKSRSTPTSSFAVTTTIFKPLRPILQRLSSDTDDVDSDDVSSTSSLSEQKLSLSAYSPELFPEMDEKVDRALNTGAPDDQLCKITPDYLLREDIKTSGRTNWLSDAPVYTPRSSNNKTTLADSRTTHSVFQQISTKHSEANNGSIPSSSSVLAVTTNPLHPILPSSVSERNSLVPPDSPDSGSTLSSSSAVSEANHLSSDTKDQDIEDLQILSTSTVPQQKSLVPAGSPDSGSTLSSSSSSSSSAVPEAVHLSSDTKDQDTEDVQIFSRSTVSEQKSLVPADSPELIPEMEEAVDQALNTGSPDDQLCKTTSNYLLRKDIIILGGTNWLNDGVINAYFDLIVERSKQDGFPSVYAYNTFFYTIYKSGYAKVKQWTRKLDIFSFDLNFVPMHILDVHWSLAVIDHRLKKICYYDSLTMSENEKQCLDLLQEYLCLEYKDKKGADLDPCTYTTEIMKDIPQQTNGCDCGVFALKYAEYISRDAEITFSQGHIPYFRRKMVYELLKGQLL